ncbi:MAG: hypothetical protein AVDCRST_MAG25-244, partial [uncultured Rubrobacteraceae bacterium]
WREARAGVSRGSIDRPLWSTPGTARRREPGASWNDGSGRATSSSDGGGDARSGVPAPGRGAWPSRSQDLSGRGSFREEVCTAAGTLWRRGFAGGGFGFRFGTG